MDRLLLTLDRTIVLFLGLVAGALIALAFLPGGGNPASVAQATAEVPRQPPAGSWGGPRGPDATGSRLADAIARRRPIDVGIFGDSFGDGVWSGLDNNLRRAEGFEVHQFSERSTGFTRYRSLNLLDDVRTKLDRQPIDIAILSFGANDTQGIYLDGHGNTYMSPGWQRIVSERVDAIVHLLRARGIMVYWVGLPKMRDAGFDADIARMNAFYADHMRTLGVPYIETAPVSVDASGHYSAYLHDPVRGEQFLARTNDGIHMTIPGYVMAMRGLSERIRASVAEARGAAVRSAARPAAPDGAHALRSAG